MVRKLLTAIDQINERAVTNVLTVTSGSRQLLMMRNVAQQTLTAIQRAEAIPFLNVQRLMTMMRIMEISRLLPLITPREAIQTLSTTLLRTLEEEDIQRRRILPYRITEEAEHERPQRLKPEVIRQTLRQVTLDSTSINYIEQRILCELESWLFLNYPLQTLQILGVMAQQAIKKFWFCEAVVGLEALQKLMLQLYQFLMMEFPAQMVLMGLRVTPLTMTVLRHKVGSVYMTMALQEQAVSQKALLTSATKQKLETKMVTSGKGRQEVIPIKQNVSAVTDLTEDTLVSMGRDAMGKEWLFTTLRYAYSIPFFVRRMLVRNMGMPENHKYARYFGIGCIPTRYARRSFKRRSYDDYSGFLYSRDEQIRKYIIWKELHNVGVPYKGRYGGTRIFQRKKIGRFT